LEDNETIKGGKQCVFFQNNQDFEKIPKNPCTSNLKIEPSPALKSKELDLIKLRTSDPRN
jgi:hypothetical protein